MHLQYTPHPDTTVIRVAAIYRRSPMGVGAPTTWCFNWVSRSDRVTVRLLQLVMEHQTKRSEAERAAKDWKENSDYLERKRKEIEGELLEQRNECTILQARLAKMSESPVITKEPAQLESEQEKHGIVEAAKEILRLMSEKERLWEDFDHFKRQSTCEIDALKEHLTQQLAYMTVQNTPMKCVEVEALKAERDALQLELEEQQMRCAEVEALKTENEEQTRRMQSALSTRGQNLEQLLKATKERYAAELAAMTQQIDGLKSQLMASEELAASEADQLMDTATTLAASEVDLCCS